LRGGASHKNLGVLGFIGLFVVQRELFKKFFTGANTTELNVDVFAGHEATQHDKVCGEINNLHRLAHVEHKDFTALTHGTRLQDQLTGLRNRHKVATHFGVRHRDRAAFANLFSKDGNHRARRTQHVSKTHGDKTRL